jgi:class 3 adenylate cyclase
MYGAIVREDFERRRGYGAVFEKSLQASAGGPLETRSLGHPDFADLDVGAKRTADMVAVFLDLSKFTGRTFCDDQEQTADLAHAVLTGFIRIVSDFGGHPLGLRGDGLFAGFSPGDPALTAVIALAACATALSAVENEVNPWLNEKGIEPVRARAGLDFGAITFVRSGNRQRSEINPIGFAANFAAKCEKVAKSWEVVVGEGLVQLLPDTPNFTEHARSPKYYTQNYKTRAYSFYDYRWRRALPHLSGVAEALTGMSTSDILAR